MHLVPRNLRPKSALIRDSFRHKSQKVHRKDLPTWVKSEAKVLVRRLHLDPARDLLFAYSYRNTWFKLPQFNCWVDTWKQQDRPLNFLHRLFQNWSPEPNLWEAGNKCDSRLDHSKPKNPGLPWHWFQEHSCEENDSYWTLNQGCESDEVHKRVFTPVLPLWSLRNRANVLVLWRLFSCGWFWWWRN